MKGCYNEFGNRYNSKEECVRWYASGLIHHLGKTLSDDSEIVDYSFNGDIVTVKFKVLAKCYSTLEECEADNE